MKSWVEVKQMDIREVVADPDWQLLRESFVGTWREREDENVLKLIRYLEVRPEPIRVRRVYNYLTGSGFRMGQIGQGDACQYLLSCIRVIYKHELKPTPERFQDHANYLS